MAAGSRFVYQGLALMAALLAYSAAAFRLGHRLWNWGNP